MMGRFIPLLAVLGLVAAPVSAQQSPSQPFPPMPAAGMPKPFKVPAAESFTLRNGMKVNLIRYGKIPNAVVTLRVYAGGLNQGEDVWLPTLTGQMLREGAAGRSAADIAKAAAGMGGELSTGTGNHETVASLTVLAEQAAEAVQLVADVARRPAFPAAELERVRASLQRNLAVAKSQPQAAAEVALAKAYYGPDHPYGRPVPTDAQLAGYTLADVQRFHRDNFGARRAQLYIAGQFDPAAVKAAIEKAFGDWQPGPERLSLPVHPKAGPQVLLVDRPGAPQSTIRIAFPAPLITDTDDLAFRVTDALLGGAFNSRITTNIREQKGYTYSPYSALSYNPGEARWTFNADVTTAATGPALKEVIGEIRRLQTEAPGMRTYAAGIFVLQNASALGLVNSLANRDFYGLPANWLDRFVPGVLAVKADQMQALARTWLPVDKMILIVVGDLKTVEPQLKAMPELQGMTMRRIDPFAVGGD